MGESSAILRALPCCSASTVAINDIWDRPPSQIECPAPTSDPAHHHHHHTGLAHTRTGPLGPSREADAGPPPPPGSQWSSKGGGRQGGENDSSSTTSSSRRTLGAGLGLAAAALHHHQPDSCVPRWWREQWRWGRGRWRGGGGGGWVGRAAGGGRELRHVQSARAAAGSGWVVLWGWLLVCIYGLGGKSI